MPVDRIEVSCYECGAPYERPRFTSFFLDTLCGACRAEFQRVRGEWTRWSRYEE